MDACWALWTFSANWQTFLYQNVTYGGNPCVTYAEPCEMDVLQVDNDQHKFQARGTDQWISVWGLTVCFDFLTSAMQSIG
jgi:hypothetical protein